MADSRLWVPAYIGLGANLGDARRSVREALARLPALPDTRLVLTSSLYRSDPMGPSGQADYVNAVAAVITQLEPDVLLRNLLDIELAMGRVRGGEKWGPRTIDLDLLVFGRARTRTPGLTIPHPGVHLRNFVLYPLAEIAPALQVPGRGRVMDLLEDAGTDGLEKLE